jgi:hypothetical protein
MDRVQNSLNIPLTLFEASLLASTEALLNGIEETEVTWCYIRAIGRMKHFCEPYIERNSLVVFEL